MYNNIDSQLSVAFFGNTWAIASTLQRDYLMLTLLSGLGDEITRTDWNQGCFRVWVFRKPINTSWLLKNDCSFCRHESPPVSDVANSFQGMRCFSGVDFQSGATVTNATLDDNNRYKESNGADERVGNDTEVKYCTTSERGFYLSTTYFANKEFDQICKSRYLSASTAVKCSNHNPLINPHLSI